MLGWLQTCYSRERDLGVLLSDIVGQLSVWIDCVSVIAFPADEETRIYRAGGWIECSRVNGNLALSRAIGDFSFKNNKDLTPEEQIITGTQTVS